MLRRIIGWRRLPGEEWSKTMRRMNCRMRNADALYYCEAWSIKYARNLWYYALHLAKSPLSTWRRLLIVESQQSKSDPVALFIPCRNVGRPKMRWDDSLASFLLYHFPLQSNINWLNIMRSFPCSHLEDELIAFYTS